MYLHLITYIMACKILSTFMSCIESLKYYFKLYKEKRFKRLNNGTAIGFSILYYCYNGGGGVNVMILMVQCDWFSLKELYHTTIMKTVIRNSLDCISLLPNLKLYFLECGK